MIYNKSTIAVFPYILVVIVLYLLLYSVHKFVQSQYSHYFVILTYFLTFFLLAIILSTGIAFAFIKNNKRAPFNKERSRITFWSAFGFFILLCAFDIIYANFISAKIIDEGSLQVKNYLNIFFNFYISSLMYICCDLSLGFIAKAFSKKFFPPDVNDLKQSKSNKLDFDDI